MSFIHKDQKMTSWQTKTKHNFIETSVTSSFLSSFFPSRLELFCSTEDVSCVKLQVGHTSVAYFFFFLPPRFVYISVSPNCSELAFVLGFNVKFGSKCLPLFSSHRPSSSFWCFGNLQNHPVFWRYTRPFWLQTANSYEALKAEDIPRNCI